MENLPIKVEVKVDLTEVTNSTYKDGVSGPVKEIGKFSTNLLGFINNTLMLPIQLYNILAEREIKKIKETIENGISKIPEDKLISPKINVIGPAVEALKYNLDEKELKDMFTNLLIKSCNIDYSDKVLPAYVEIIKQLSKLDVLFLSNIYKDKKFDYKYILNPYASYIENGNKVKKEYNLYFLDIIDLTESSISNIMLSVDNLIRLNLINITFIDSISDKSGYNLIFNKYLYLIENDIKQDNITIKYDEGILKLTDLGSNMLDICI